MTPSSGLAKDAICVKCVFLHPRTFDNNKEAIKMCIKGGRRGKIFASLDELYSASVKSAGYCITPGVCKTTTT